MKKFLRIGLLALFATSSLFYSCETTELEILDNPNALSDDQADPNLLLNSIQRAYVTNMVTFNDRSSELGRIDYIGGRDYFAMYNSSALDGVWSRFYSAAAAPAPFEQGMGANINAIIALNESPDLDLSYHLGVSKALQAHQLMLMVDFLGDIPWSEALNPLEFPSPNVDDDTTVYQVALDILNQAEGHLNDFIGTFTNPGDAAAAGAVTDFFYGDAMGQNGDPAKWKKLINTLKMRHALTTGDVASFNAIAGNANNYISSSEDDFQFQYGTQLLTPNTQHQDYFNDYTTSGANIYQSNWLMEVMQGDNKADGSDDDPRIRYYYYRQAGCTPGASCDPDGDGQFLSCSLETPPAHYSGNGVSYCWLEDGYWGRDHGDDDGTPPDNFLRTAVGVYPAGGSLDNDRFRNGSVIFDEDDGVYVFSYATADDGVNQGNGGQGAGIEPIILASYVDFWRAEVALASGNAGQAANLVEAGLTKSIAKVTSFASLDGQASLSDLLDDTEFNTATGEITTNSFSGDLIPDADYINAFIAEQGDKITGNNPDSWNALAEQYFITMYGGGSDAYNFYRRTGYPTTAKPNLEPNPGVFPRTFLYPSVEVIANPSITQRQDNATQVFWDTNPAGPSFPPAN